MISHSCVDLESSGVRGVCMFRCAHLDRHVVDVEAEGDPLVERQLRLSGPVDVHGLLGLDEAFLVVDAGLDHAVTDRL